MKDSANSPATSLLPWNFRGSSSDAQHPLPLEINRFLICVGHQLPGEGLSPNLLSLSLWGPLTVSAVLTSYESGRCKGFRNQRPFNNKFLNAGLLGSTNTPYSSLFYSSKRQVAPMVQPRIYIVNEEGVLLHSAVPNPDTILGSMPPNTQVFTVLPLKDAFFTIPLSWRVSGYMCFDMDGL